MRNATFKMENEIGYVEEETAKLKVPKQEVADAIVGNRNIEYPIDEYYKTHYTNRTEQEIKEEKEQKDFCRLQLNIIKRALRLQDI